jgi:type II secretory pathway component PulF
MYHADRPASFVPDVGYLCETCTDFYVGEGTMDETKNQEATCYEKAKANGEPTFTLRAQDISAHLVVEFWAAIQQAIRNLMDNGATMTEAVEYVRSYHNVPRLAAMTEGMSEKDREALSIASAMMQWNKRKLAD